MILLDAYCLIALARDEPAAKDVERLLRREEVGIVSVNLAEVVDYLVRRAGWPEDDAARHVGLLDPVLATRAVDGVVGARAGLIRARHYDRGRCPLSLADAFLLAATENGDSVATADPALADVARREGIGLIALPGTDGSVP